MSVAQQILASLNQGVSASGTNLAVVVSSVYSPYIHAYQFNTVTGFGTKYANPGTLPAGSGTGIKFSPNGKVVFMSMNGNNPPFINAYAWDDATGFGTKYSDPATMPVGTVGGLDVGINNAGTVVGVWSSTTAVQASVNFYQWDDITGFGTRFSNPATSLTLNIQASSIEFSPTDSVISVGLTASAGVFMYQWNNTTGFGTKYANFTTIAGSFPIKAKFSPSGTVVALALGTTAKAYPWNDATGFGTKYTDPTGGFGSSTSVSFSPDGTALVYGYGASPFAFAHHWDNTTGFGAAYTAPTPLGVGTGKTGHLSKDGSVFFVGIQQAVLTKSLEAISWNNTTGFGAAKYTSLPAYVGSITVLGIDTKII